MHHNNAAECTTAALDTKAAPRASDKYNVRMGAKPGDFTKAKQSAKALNDFWAARGVTANARVATGAVIESDLRPEHFLRVNTWPKKIKPAVTRPQR